LQARSGFNWADPAGMVEDGIEALKHGGAWLTTAWTAHGKPELIVEASKEFLRMLVAVAVAALSYAGAEANYGKALKIANNMPTGGLPAFATAGARANGGARAGAGVAIGPSVGGPAAVGAAATRLSDKEKAALGDGPDVDRLGERDVGEARSSERRDRRAAEGRERPAPETTRESGGSEAMPTNETRTELAKHIPPPRRRLRRVVR
jgi:hypothetical protein